LNIIEDQKLKKQIQWEHFIGNHNMFFFKRKIKVIKSKIKLK